MATARIGCSGFFYEHWRGEFYPADVQKKHWLPYYCTRFSTVELNTTFYNIPSKEAFSRWYQETPAGFVFTLKGSRFITHVKKLKTPAEPVEAFFSRASALKEKLGVVLWQLPPGFKADPARLADFLELLRPYGIRSAFEFRDETWISRKVISLMEKENVCLCIADWPQFLGELPVTSDFVYIRRHGREGSCATSYHPAELKADFLKIRKYLRQRKDVFLYFNNDACGYAPKNALELVTLFKKGASLGRSKSRT